MSLPQAQISSKQPEKKNDSKLPNIYSPFEKENGTTERSMSIKKTSVSNENILQKEKKSDLEKIENEEEDNPPGSSRPIVSKMKQIRIP